MAMWYIYSNSGSRLGPLTDQAFRKLIQQGKVQRNTIVANQFGRTVTAGSIPGLPFPYKTDEMKSLGAGENEAASNAASRPGQADIYDENPFSQSPPNNQADPFQNQSDSYDNPFVMPEEQEPREGAKPRNTWIVVAVSVVVLLVAFWGWQGVSNLDGKVTIAGKTFNQPDPIHGIRLGDKLSNYRRGKWRTDYTRESEDDDVLILRPNGEKGLIFIGADKPSKRVTSISIYFGSLLIDEEREKFEKEKRYVEANYHYVKFMYGDHKNNYYLYQTTSNGCTVYASVDIVSSDWNGPTGVFYSLKPPTGM